MKSLKFFLISFLFFSPLATKAYVGPGLDLGLIGSFFGVVLSLFITVVSIFWYSIKTFFKKLGVKKKDDLKNEK